MSERLELLLGLEPGGALVEMGCGSGVLAIAAAKLGWTPVVGIDRDEQAVRATVANAAANGVRVEARRHDLLRDGPAPGAPTVVANLLRPLLLRVAADGFARAAPTALVAGGLLMHCADAVARVPLRWPARGGAADRRRVGRAAAARLSTAPESFAPRAGAA